MIKYQQYEKRVPDIQYRMLLKRIITEGENIDAQQGVSARRIIGHQMKFDLSNGFPMITERDLSPSFHQAIGELIAFMNGARTHSELEFFGCKWWKHWVTKEKCAKRGLEEGDLGPGSYGAAWHDFPTSEGNFNQIKSIYEQMAELPHLRTHFISPWIPQFIVRGRGKQQKVVVAPCHGWVHLCPNTRTKELILHHFQRSADAPVGLVFNIMQYAALAMMFAQVIGYKAKELVYTLSDVHIFDGQMDYVEKLLSTEPGRFPTVTLDGYESIGDIFSFRHQFFTVKDYHPRLPPMRIWTPI